MRAVTNTIPSVRPRTATLIIIALAGAAVLGGCDKRAPNEGAATSGVTSANLADKVDQARTPADHQALAAYYEEQARRTQREASAEREAGTRYERRWNPDDHPMGRGAREHYNHMLEGREEGASDYRAMAEWHRQMATHAEREVTTDE